ncbi:oxidoreductase [Nocardia inohanensis]|uniref:oxidoreductase n=1 Tax=Nocardia inohanensis TaxID=209246 RepID=UPI001FDF290C|nr:oxidoreductase [Nocardia inohanensis]
MAQRTTSWTVAVIPDLSGRTAVVTGASAGIGIPTARLLAEHGARVVLACRNVEKASGVAEAIRRSAPEAELRVVRLDLASMASVRLAAQELRELYGSIDLLINNAGTACARPSRTEDGFETTIATNHLGPFAFTGLLLDRLLAAPAGRIVSVSSNASGWRNSGLELDDLFYERRRYRALTAYAQSKLANLMCVLEMQRRLNGIGTALVSVAARPGVAQSDFDQSLGPVFRRAARSPLRFVIDPFKQTTEMGALPTLRAAVDPEVRGGEFVGPTGRWKGFPVFEEPPAAARDPELAARLWAESERLTGVRFDFEAAVGN